MLGRNDNAMSTTRRRQGRQTETNETTEVDENPEDFEGGDPDEDDESYAFQQASGKDFGTQQPLEEVRRVRAGYRELLAYTEGMAALPSPAYQLETDGDRCLMIASRNGISTEELVQTLKKADKLFAKGVRLIGHSVYMSMPADLLLQYTLHKKRLWILGCLLQLQMWVYKMPNGCA